MPTAAAVVPQQAVLHFYYEYHEEALETDAITGNACLVVCHRRQLARKSKPQLAPAEKTIQPTRDSTISFV